MKLKTCAVVCVSFLVLASQLSAFDGQRKGFILGGGVGVGSLSWSEGNLDFSEGVFATNFIIGYAPSNSLEIYYTNNLSLFNGQDYTYYIGVTGVGVTKYLKPSGKGLYFLGGIGLSVGNGYWEYSTGSESGFGAIAGIGCDVAKHWRIQGEVIYSDTKDTNSWSFRATINVIAF
jgi:Outer membrane protein beta-barrel domain